MGYWKAKDDQFFIQCFHGHLLGFWERENLVRGIEESVQRFGIPMIGLSPVPDEQAMTKHHDNYQASREQIAKEIPRITRLATMLGARCHLKSFPAPAVGGPVITLSVFEAILNDTSHDKVVTRQLIIDTLNETKSLCEEYVRQQRSRLFNPFYWLKALFVMIIRLPFTVVSMSGFDVSKVEDHLISKVFKLVELLAIFYFLIHIGMQRTDILDTIKKLILK